MKQRYENTDLTSCTGWLLDVSIDNDRAILSIKTEEDGQILKLRDSYYAALYILPRTESDGYIFFKFYLEKKRSQSGGKKINIQTFLTVIKQENLSTYSYDR
jgi:hypothetical protein